MKIFKIANENNDEAYLSAVERGDISEVQRMVDNEAKAKGYNIGPVWHGTDENFSSFNSETWGYNTGTGDIGDGFYFTSNSNYAKEFGSNLMRVFLKIAKPAGNKILSNEKVINAIDDDMGFTTVQEVLNGMGYDSIISTIRGQNEDEIVVWNPSQIKSADPITYDSAGIIPLSKRFDSTNNGIFY